MGLSFFFLVGVGFLALGIVLSKLTSPLLYLACIAAPTILYMDFFVPVLALLVPVMGRVGTTAPSGKSPSIDFLIILRYG